MEELKNVLIELRNSNKTLNEKKINDNFQISTKKLILLNEINKKLPNCIEIKEVKECLMNLKYIMENYTIKDQLSMKIGYPLCIYAIEETIKNWGIGNGMTRDLKKLIKVKLERRLSESCIHGRFVSYKEHSLTYGGAGVLIYILSIYNKYDIDEDLERMRVYLKYVLNNKEFYGMDVPTGFIYPEINRNDKFKNGYFDNGLDTGSLGICIALSLIGKKEHKNICGIIERFSGTKLINNKIIFINKKYVSFDNWLTRNNKINNDIDLDELVDYTLCLYVIGNIYNDKLLLNKSYSNFAFIKNNAEKLEHNFLRYILLLRKFNCDEEIDDIKNINIYSSKDFISRLNYFIAMYGDIEDNLSLIRNIIICS
ncbi:MAG: hypothetical protein RSD47_06850 [Romboutsia sp.]